MPTTADAERSDRYLIQAVTERIVRFAVKEGQDAAKDASDLTHAESITLTALGHAYAALVADTAGKDAEGGKVLEAADIAAGQVFNAVPMYHALRTCRWDEYAAQFGIAG